MAFSDVGSWHTGDWRYPETVAPTLAGAVDNADAGQFAGLAAARCVRSSAVGPRLCRPVAAVEPIAIA
ncbi:hypothetical protein D3C79_1056410 [compost metagenome]